MKALINFILLTKFVSLQISVTTQNISLFTICNERKARSNEVQKLYPKQQFKVLCSSFAAK